MPLHRGTALLALLVLCAVATEAVSNVTASPAANATHPANATQHADNATKPAQTPAAPSNPNPAAAGAGAKLGPVTQPEDKYFGNVQVARILQARELVTGSFIGSNVTVKANLDCAHVLSAKIVKADTVSAKSMVVGAIRSKSGTVIFNSDVQLTSKDNQVQATSFLAENVVIGGVPQWKLVRHDDFENEASTAGWSLLETSSCSANGDRFLGGHCNIANGEVSKVYRNLPPHKQVRVAARYHFIDNWQGETAFLKLGEHISWAHRSRKSDSVSGIEMCGNADFPEHQMSLPIDVTQTHSDSFLQVSFGSRGGDADQDPCQRSFGVDDVMVYVR